MATRWEYINASYVSVAHTDERNLSVDAPEAQDVLVLYYDEAIVITGTFHEMVAMVGRIMQALGTPPTPFDDVDDLQECQACGEHVITLSSDGRCDGCIELEEQTQKGASDGGSGGN